MWWVASSDGVRAGELGDVAKALERIDDLVGGGAASAAGEKGDVSTHPARYRRERLDAAYCGVELSDRRSSLRGERVVEIEDGGDRPDNRREVNNLGVVAGGGVFGWRWGRIVHCR